MEESMAISDDAYRVFYHVAICKSFTRAAQVLNSSQPNITRIIRQLEQELGCRLFTRSNKGIVLTAEGEILFAHAQTAVQHISRAEAELKSRSGMQTGQVTIAASEAALRSVLLPALRDYRRDFPSVQVNVHSMTTENAMRQILHHLADVAITTKPLRRDTDLRLEELADFPDVLIAPPALAAGVEAPCTPERAARWPFISMHRQSVSYEMLRGYFSRHGVLFQPTTYVSSLSQIVPMVSSGLGAAILPAFMAAAQLRAGEVVQVPLTDAPPAHTVCMITHVHRTHSAACEELLLRLRQKR